MGIIKNSIIGFTVALTLIVGGCGMVSQGDERPNVILILADDMGYSDLGAYGSEINTPSLDKLADNGLKMTQFYNASRCCPTRASLLTGLYPHQANMGFMQENCFLPGYGGHIPNSAATIAQALKANGYNTAMSGKWHVGNDEAYWPTKKGFDKFYGFPHHGGAYFFPFPGDQVLMIGDSIIEDPGEDYYSTEAINEYAGEFVEEMVRQEEPFFLYLAHVAPHFPLQAREVDIQKYRGKYAEGFEVVREARFAKMKNQGIIDENYPISEIDGKVPVWDSISVKERDDFDLRMSVYAAQIESMDRGIGELVDRLRKLGELENTLIIFLSDNGGTREEYSWGDSTIQIGKQGSFGCYGLPWANVSNTPYRMFKHWGYEGGIRTPMIVHYPRLITEPRVDHQPAHIIDIMPTVMELAHSKYPVQNNGTPTQALEGTSLVPVFQGQNRSQEPRYFWEHEGNKAARVGKWKWVNAYPDEVDQLFDLTSDPTENHDLSQQQPERLAEIKREWGDWAERVGVIEWDSVLQVAPRQERLQIWY